MISRKWTRMVINQEDKTEITNDRLEKVDQIVLKFHSGKHSSFNKQEIKLQSVIQHKKVFKFDHTR